MQLSQSMQSPILQIFAFYADKRVKCFYIRIYTDAAYTTAKTRIVYGLIWIYPMYACIYDMD